MGEKSELPLWILKQKEQTGNSGERLQLNKQNKKHGQETSGAKVREKNIS